MIWSKSEIDGVTCYLNNTMQSLKLKTSPKLGNDVHAKINSTITTFIMAIFYKGIAEPKDFLVQESTCILK